MIWYEEEVRGLEKYCAAHVNGTRPPVFYGSSSIRLWSTLAEDIDPRILNLGFGGSTLEACDYFFERLVVPPVPRSLLLYAGDNDLGDGRSVEQTLASFRSLADKVEKLLGPIPFGFVSVKPSPARIGIIDRIKLLNRLVSSDMRTRKHTFFVNVFPLMLDSAKRPRKKLFQEDGLHLSSAGYKLWAQALQPVRDQILTP